MTEYIIFGLIIIILSIMSEISGKRYVGVLMLYLLFLSFFLIGCRYDIGADWSNYKFFYENGYTDTTISGTQELGYTIWNRIISWTTLPSGFYFGITAFVSLLLIYNAAKIFQIRNIPFVFLIYYCLFMGSLQFNIIRTGLLGSCLILSFAYKSINKNKLSLLWLVIGISMHYMGLIFIPVWFIIDKQIKTKYLIILSSCALVVFLSGVGRLINTYASFLFLFSTRLEGYTNTDADGYGLSVGLVFNIIFFTYLWVSNRHKYKTDVQFRILMNCFLTSLLIALAFSDLGIFVARLGQVLNLSLTMLWPIFLVQQKKAKNFKGLRVIFVTLFLSVYLWSYFSKSIGYDDDTSTSSYPYNYNIEQLYKTIN